MVIPYLAIVSCAMLAANSPSALEGIVSDGGSEALRDEYDVSYRAQLIKQAKSHKFVAFLLRQFEGYNPIETAYEGHFRASKLWKRGLNKRQWVQEAIRDYSDTYSCSHSSVSEDQGEGKGNQTFITPTALRQSLALDRGDCFNIVAGALFLLLTPCALAFLTSYNTPRAGLSCRSVTYLVYGISQACEVVLWIWEVSLKIRHENEFGKANTLKAVCWCGQCFIGFFAILAAVGGTFLQLLGVYRSCACKVRVFTT